MVRALIVVFGFADSPSITMVSAQQRNGGPNEAAAVETAAQQRVQPPIDRAAVERGSQIFEANCRFCHGEDPSGTEAGPDLARSFIVTGDQDGKGIREFLLSGRPEKGMPGDLIYAFSLQ